MKNLVLIPIRLYWRIIPPKIRQRCLFKESCSHHVFNVTTNEGFIEGIKALRFRIKNCRAGYSVIEIEGHNVLITANNQIIKHEEIAIDITDK